MAFPHLLSPFSIGNVALRNRIVFQPHFTALGTLDGEIEDAVEASRPAMDSRMQRFSCPGLPASLPMNGDAGRLAQVGAPIAISLSRSRFSALRSQTTRRKTVASEELVSFFADCARGTGNRETWRRWSAKTGRWCECSAASRIRFVGKHALPMAGGLS